MSWPDMMTPWAPGDGCDPLTIDILGGLAYAALTARPHHDPDCQDCQDGGQPCPDHAGDADLADRFEHAYMRVATGSTAWCDLAVKLISEMN